MMPLQPGLPAQARDDARRVGRRSQRPPAAARVAVDRGGGGGRAEAAEDGVGLLVAADEGLDALEHQGEADGGFVGRVAELAGFVGGQADQIARLVDGHAGLGGIQQPVEAGGRRLMLGTAES